jgi:hypothetical protein
MTRTDSDARRRAVPVAVLLVWLLAAAAGCHNRPPHGGPPPVDPVPARFRGFDSELYRQDANWLCRPGTTARNACTARPLDATVIEADGARHIDPRPPLDQRRPTAKVDCFYVYPTVNFDDSQANDLAMAADDAAETFVTQAQFAPYVTRCNAFAPLYRQASLGHVFSDPDAQKLAYGDVRDAFRYYMAHFNQGRPIVFVGHSQGSGMLGQLLHDEFDGDDELRPRLLSALLIGGGTDVPVGGDVGGTFARLPLCHGPADRSCIVGFNTYAADAPPGPDALFGGGHAPGFTGACVSPAALSGREGGGLAAVLPTFGDEAPPGLQASRFVPPGPPVTTRWIELPGALTGECRTTAEGRTYLAVAAAVTPGDVRDVSPLLQGPSAWGLHIPESNLAQGDLLDWVTAQSLRLGSA